MAQNPLFRRSGQNQPLEEICNNDSDFKIRHRGLCATLQKMRSGKTMQIDVEEQNGKRIAKTSVPKKIQIVEILSSLIPRWLGISQDVCTWKEAQTRKHLTKF